MDYLSIIKGRILQHNEYMAELYAKEDKELESHAKSLRGGLEQMCASLRERNKQTGKLSDEEEAIVENVGSGKFKKALSLLPEQEAEKLEERIMLIYERAIKKKQGDELVLCGYLNCERREDNTTYFMLTLPVKFSDREKKNTLEEALYEHSVNVGEFSGEREHEGYVQLTEEVNSPDAVKFATSMVSRLEKDLSPELARRNVKYGVVILDEKLLSSLKEGARVEVSVEGAAQEKKHYTPMEAAEVWLKRHKELGIRVPVDNLYKIVRVVGKPYGNQIIKQSIRSVKEGDALLIEKDSFDKFIKGYVMQMSSGGTRYVLTPITEEAEKHIKEVMNDVVSVSEAAEKLDASNSYVWSRIREGKLKRTVPGYITRESLENFMQTCYKAGGLERTKWIRKRRTK